MVCWGDGNHVGVLPRVRPYQVAQDSTLSAWSQGTGLSAMQHPATTGSPWQQPQLAGRGLSRTTVVQRGSSVVSMLVTPRHALVAAAGDASLAGCSHLHSWERTSSWGVTQGLSTLDHTSGKRMPVGACLTPSSAGRGRSGDAGSLHPTVQRVLQTDGTSRCVPRPPVIPSSAATAASSFSPGFYPVSAAGSVPAASTEAGIPEDVWQQMQHLAFVNGRWHQLLQQVWAPELRRDAARSICQELGQQQVQSWCEAAAQAQQQRAARTSARWEQLARGLQRRQRFAALAAPLQEAWANSKRIAEAAARSAAKAVSSAARVTALQKQLQHIRAARAVQRWRQLVQGMRRRRFQIYMAAALRRGRAKMRKTAEAAAVAAANCEALQQQLQGLQAELTAKGGQMQQAAAVQSQLRQQVGGLQQQLMQAQHQMGGVQQHIGMMQRQLGAANAACKAAQGKAAEWESSCNRVNSHLCQVSKEVSGLRAAKQTAEHEVADLREQVVYKDKLLADLPEHMEWQQALQSVQSSGTGSSNSSSNSSLNSSSDDDHSTSRSTSISSSSPGSAARRLSLDVVSTAYSAPDAASPRKAHTPGKPGQDSSKGALSDISEVISPEGSLQAACSPNTSTTLTSSSSAVSICSSVPSAPEQDGKVAPAAAAAAQLLLQQMGPKETEFHVSQARPQLCHKSSSTGSTDSMTLLTPGGLPGVVAQCGQQQQEQLLGQGGEGWVYALPHAEVLVPLVDQPAAVYRLPAAVKIVVLEDDEAGERFLHEAHQVAAVAAALPQVLPVLAAWVQQGQSPATGNSASIGVLLMPQLQHTLLQVADTLVALQQQQEQQEQEKDSTRGEHRKRAHWALKVLEMGLGMQAQGWQHRDWKAANVMLDVKGRMWLVDAGHAFQLTQQQQQISEIDQCTPITAENSCPEQLLAGNGLTILSNDTFALGATGLEVLLGKEAFQELLLPSRVPWAMGRISCLFPPSDVQLQQQQLLRLGGALWRWLKAARATQDRQLLMGLALLTDMLQPAPEKRLHAHAAQAQLQEILYQADS